MAYSLVVFLVITQLAICSAAAAEDFNCNVVGNQLIVQINNFASDPDTATVVVNSPSNCELLRRS